MEAIGAAHVWVVDLDAAWLDAGWGGAGWGGAGLVDTPALEAPALDAGWLDGRERRRAAALRDATASRRYLTAHAVLRLLLSEATGQKPGEVGIGHEPCTACGGDHGRPVTPGGPHFSLSRSGSWAAVAIAQDARVGIDFEVRQHASRLEPLRSTLLAPGEHSDDLLRTWVRKEALLKASGEGLNRPMNTVAQDAPGVHDLDLPARLVGAVAGVDNFIAASLGSDKVRQPTDDRSPTESLV